MPVDFACGCGQRYRVKDGSSGRTIQCRACRANIEVPGSGAVDLGIVTDRGFPTPSATATAPAPAVLPFPFEYRMVQLAQRVEVKEGSSHRRVLADYLQDIVNKMALDGWEFQRVDSFAVTEAPGCLGSLFGRGPVSVSYYVATFRRPR